MKLKAEMGHWSSIVGGGVHLIGEDGRMVGQIAILCHSDEIRDKDVQMGLSRAICDTINAAASAATPMPTESTATEDGTIKPTPDLFTARICEDMPTDCCDCCDYGVISLVRRAEVCRVWDKDDARLIASLLSDHARASPVPVSTGAAKERPFIMALRHTTDRNPLPTGTIKPRGGSDCPICRGTGTRDCSGSIVYEADGKVRASSSATTPCHCAYPAPAPVADSQNKEGRT